MQRTVYEYGTKIDPPVVPSLNPGHPPQRYVGDGVLLYLHNLFQGLKIWAAATIIQNVYGNIKLANKVLLTLHHTHGGITFGMITV
jgi:hypothetical protein